MFLFFSLWVGRVEPLEGTTLIMHMHAIMHMLCTPQNVHAVIGFRRFQFFAAAISP